VLLTMPPERRDPRLGDAMLEAVLSQILIDAPAPADAGPMATTVAFRAVAPRLDALTGPERQLLAEWLDRVIAALA
jgi:hypothetical protein